MVVSIIIPNHNKAQFLPECLDSIINQTYRNWEIIIVDDGSTDSSKVIIEDYSKKDPRISFIFIAKQPNGGSVCRNIGLEKVVGKFIVFLDSDDVLIETCLEQRVRFLEKNPSLDFAVFNMGTFYNKIRDSDSIWKPHKAKALECFLSHQLPWQTMQPIYIAEFIKENNLLFDESLPRLQDVDFHTSILFLKPNFEVLTDNPDCYYRIIENRKVVDNQSFYGNYALAMSKYYLKFSVPKTIKHLNLTILAGISLMIDACLKNKLDKKHYKSYIQELTKHVFGINKKILIVYAKMGYLIPFHIPGMRLFFKKLISI